MLARTLIRPPTGWQLVNLRELWRYRELLFFLAWRDVKVRYKQTVLGAAWAVLQPALMMVVFSIFFGRLAHVDSGGLPYPLFVFAGLLPWTLFATAIASAGNSVVGSERLITKIYFPRLAIPFAAVGAALVDFLVAFGMLVVLMFWYRVPPTWGLMVVPVLVALFTLAALGVGTLLAALNVAYRDFRYVIPFLVQLWMFATPSIYMNTEEGSGFRVQERVQGSGFRVQQSDEPLSTNPKSKIENPKLLHSLLALNPLTGLVASFRAAVLGGPLPWSMLGWSSLEVVASLLVGCLYFRRVEDSFADII
ncbi:MAG TPA: ABC transporter permease [Pirellulales bacterium]|nr:ABC transporter permease [Pirellulales bacterium]